jgi:Flp pilus assembly protein TadG
MRRLSDDQGSVVVIAIAAVVLMFAIGAIVFDVAGLFHNRRFLQNGADAGALAIAQMCAGGDCVDPFATAQQYADANSNGGTVTIDEVCGSGVTGAGACTDPPDLPAGASYVRVTASHYVAYTFGRLIGVDGNTMKASATVAWGGPSRITSEMPVTMSQCEFNSYTSDNTDHKDPPPYDAGYPTPEAVVYFHTNSAATPCPAGPAGSDLPGGFGWLQPDTDTCRATSDIYGWWDDKTGRAVPSDCTVAWMTALVGTVIHIPLFDNTNNLNGTNGQYTMDGFAAFYLTGFSIEGQYKVDSLVSGHAPCNGSDSCISGFFVNDPTPLSSGDLGGPSLGVTLIKFIA